MERRRKYRNRRREKKTRLRAARFDNRENSKRKGRLSPTMRSKFDALHREIRFARSIHPISRMIHETGTFDPPALKNPEVLKKNALYQQGPDYGYENSKAFLLSRDGYKCQHCKGQSKDRRLHVHPRVWRSKGGSEESENLVVICKTCHDKVPVGRGGSSNVLPSPSPSFTTGVFTRFR
jgi:hypothetical protein